MLLGSKYSNFEQPVQQFPDFMMEEFPESVPQCDSKPTFRESKNETTKRTSDTFNFNFNHKNEKITKEESQYRHNKNNF